MSRRARELLSRVRRRPGAPPGLSLVPRRAYKIISVSLYDDELEYLDTLADTLKRHKNQARNRSGAIQWLIEQQMKDAVTP